MPEDYCLQLRIFLSRVLLVAIVARLFPGSGTVETEMSSDKPTVNFSAYMDRQGVFCPMLLLPGGFYALALEEIQPGTDVQVDLKELRGAGTFDQQLEILLALDNLDGEGKWLAFVQTALEIGGELYRRSQKAKG